jgi:hypothetical protein
MKEYINIFMSKIILKCVSEKNKLRIKFHTFIDTENKHFSGAYNNEYNCQFPKDIRKEGLFYEISDTDLTTVLTKGSPFYRINKKNIKILTMDPCLDVKNIKTFSVDECVVCLCNIPEMIFLPCGHQCVCKDCYEISIVKTDNCPMCRRKIEGKYFPS